MNSRTPNPRDSAPARATQGWPLVNVFDVPHVKRFQVSAIEGFRKSAGAGLLVAGHVKGGGLLIFLFAGVSHAHFNFVTSVLQSAGRQSNPEDSRPVAFNLERLFSAGQLVTRLLSFDVVIEDAKLCVYFAAVVRDLGHGVNLIAGPESFRSTT